MNKPVLVIATYNPNKAAELKAGLAGLGFEILLLSNFTGCFRVEEDGTTFSANAIKKARAAFAFTGYPSLADDSGLEVAALNGAPGVYSHRFAGQDSDDANNALLLEKLAGMPPDRRQARFRCVLALVWGSNQEVTVEGTCSGIILTAPRGAGGFGYDPLFYLPELGRTMAEITREEKYHVSHRGRAVGKLRQMLKAGYFCPQITPEDRTKIESS
ncbi:MAG: XTP/dITP diphosphatase [Firmicutes bacterium]|nr:XTP/dITP diphosphatase [Bacillota bacterium]